MATGLLLEKAFRPEKTGSSNGIDGARMMSGEQWARLRHDAHAAVLEHFQNNPPPNTTRELVEEATEALIDDVLNGANLALPQRLRAQLVTEVVDEVVGFGPMQSLIDDATISEIMVNGPRQIYIERRGRIELSDKIFLDDG